MRFRPELINGKIDKECLEISKSLVIKLKKLEKKIIYSNLTLPDK